MERKAYLHLTIHSVSRTKGTRRSTAAAEATAIAPVAASLAVRTVASHVACIATDTTDNVGGKVALLGTVILAVSDLTTFASLEIWSKWVKRESLTVLTSLVLVVTKGTVESSKLTKLVTLELVLTLGNRRSLQFLISMHSQDTTKGGNSPSQ